MRAWIAILLATAWPSASAPQQSGADAVTIQLTSARLARTSPPGILLPRIPVETESEFLTTDPFAWYLVTYSGGHKGDKVRGEWRNPLGAAIQENDVTQLANGPLRLLWRLPIAGGPAAFTPGDWQIHLFWNDHGIAVANFKISAPPESVVTLATRSLLPAGTIAVPYFLQLTARGGVPPYQWKAVKAFPDGIALAPTGTLAGTPKERGSFRATVEVKDSAGNSLVRTLGIGVGPKATNASATTSNLLKSVVPDACSQPASPPEFSASDANVVLAASLEAPRGREGRVEWLSPNGEVYLVRRVAKPAEGRACVVQTLPLAGHLAGSLPGNWRVRLLWADLEVFTMRFTVNGAKSTGGGPAPVTARRGRMAVIIGNLHYEKAPAATAASGTSAADLNLLETALRQDGFEVVRKTDVTLEDLRLIEGALSGKLQAGDTALVYYTGSSVREGGDEWLLPVNFDPGDARPIQSKAYSVLRLMQVLEDSKAGLKFIFLDASAAGQARENPGAIMGEVDDSTALIFSGPPGAAPKPGSPAPAVFPRALAEVLQRPGLDARTALQVELPKTVARLAPSSPSPMAILGGGADFVFRAPVPPAAAPAAAKRGKR